MATELGKQGKLAVGCSASVIDPESGRVLLVRRADNRRWAVPGGYMEPGESVAEACEREVREEAGIRVKVVELTAVYSDPNILLTYPDGNKWQLVVLHFLAEQIDGNVMANDETIDVGYFALEDTKGMNIGDFDRQRITDGFAFRDKAFVRDNWAGGI